MRNVQRTKAPVFRADDGKWRAVAKFSEDNYLMCRDEEGSVSYAPLCIQSFDLSAPRMDTQDVLLFEQYRSHLELDTVQDRIRWCRHKMGLLQKEIAQKLGISRNLYIAYETGTVDYYPKEIMDKLAAFFGINVFDLLDDYNRFQYNGQGRAISESRRLMGLSKKAYARMLGIDSRTLDNWEKDKKRMNKNSWEKYFKDMLGE